MIGCTPAIYIMFVQEELLRTDDRVGYAIGWPLEERRRTGGM